MEVGEELKQPGDGRWELGVGEELKQPEVGSWELGVGEEKSIIDIHSTGLIVTGSSLSPNFDLPTPGFPVFDLPTPGFQPARRPALLFVGQFFAYNAA